MKLNLISLGELMKSRISFLLSVLICLNSTMIFAQVSRPMPVPITVPRPVPRPSPIDRPHHLRPVIGTISSRQIVSERLSNQGIQKEIILPPSNGIFHHKLDNHYKDIAVGFNAVLLQNLMHHETIDANSGLNITYASDVLYPGSLVLRNCSLPYEPGALDPHGSSNWDSLKALGEDPQPNQLRFMVTVAKNLTSIPLRLELISPQIVLAAPHAWPRLPEQPKFFEEYSEFNESLVNLPIFQIPMQNEVIKAWDLDPKWELVANGLMQAKIVVNLDYIPGLKSTDGTKDITSYFFARIVSNDSEQTVISTEPKIRTVHVDFCREEHQQFVDAAMEQQKHAEEIIVATASNINNPPYSVEVVGYEPPTILTGVPACNDSRFVHTQLACAKQFPPYMGHGDSVWAEFSDMMTKLSSGFELLKQFVSKIATQIVIKFTPLGWSCQGMDKVVGTSCADKMQSVGEQVSYMAINAGLVYLGIPPSIPNAPALINNGSDYLAATAVDTALSQSGVDLPPAVQDELAGQVSNQVKQSSPMMEMQLRMQTLQNSDHTKGPWYPEPLCEELRLASSSPNVYTPTAMVYLKVTHNKNFVGDDKNWKVRLVSGPQGVYQQTVVTIPSHWQSTKDSMIIPVKMTADIDYFEKPQDQLGSQAYGRWLTYAWAGGKNSFSFSLNLFDSDLHGASDAFCKNTLGIGCAPYPQTSQSINVGSIWGIGSEAKLTRACNAEELQVLSTAPWPY